MRRTLITLVVLAILAAGGATYYAQWRTPRPPEITTVGLSRGDIVDAVSATGTLEAVTTVQVGTQVSGTIMELLADFNDQVRRGDVIARLDPSLFETQVEQARANLVRAQADVERLRVAAEDADRKLQRARELRDRRLISENDFESAEVAARAARAQLRSAEAQVEQARASLNQAQVNLEHTVIRAPIDGIVISRNVDVGQTVAASMQAPTLYVLAADLRHMQVNANIDEADIGRIRPGQRVRFRVDAYPLDEFVGTVSEVRLQPTVVQNVVTYTTVIDAPNDGLKLKPGMTATVAIEVARRENVLRIPNAALRFRPTREVFAALGQEPPEFLLASDRGRAAASAGSRAGEAAQPAAAAPSSPGEPPRESAAGGAADANRTRTAPGSREGREARGAGGAGTGRETSGAPASAAPGTPSSAESETGGPARGGRRALLDLPPAERERVLERIRARREAAGGGQAGGPGPAAGSEGGRRPGPGFFARLQELPPEERARVLERMRARSGSEQETAPARPGESSPDRNPPAGGGESAAAGPRRPAAAPPSAAAAAGGRGGSTGPGSAVSGEAETRRQATAWVRAGQGIRPLRLWLGISDGNFTEVLDTDLPEGLAIVTNVALATPAATTASGAGRSPLMPTRGPGPGGGRFGR
jgi:HlyD family secretion protein